MTKIKITKCPMCGSKLIRLVHKDVKGVFRGKAYTAKSVGFEECADCGERLYDLDAMQKLESARHAIGRRPKRLA